MEVSFAVDDKASPETHEQKLLESVKWGLKNEMYLFNLPAHLEDFWRCKEGKDISKKIKDMKKEEDGMYYIGELLERQKGKIPGGISIAEVNREVSTGLKTIT